MEELIFSFLDEKKILYPILFSKFQSLKAYENNNESTIIVNFRVINRRDRNTLNNGVILVILDRRSIRIRTVFFSRGLPSSPAQFTRVNYPDSSGMRELFGLKIVCNLFYFLLRVLKIIRFLSYIQHTSIVGSLRQKKAKKILNLSVERIFRCANYSSKFE